MTDCPDCAARRRMMLDDFLNARIADALAQAVAGAAELVGLKPKTGAAEEAARTTATTTTKTTAKAAE